MTRDGALLHAKHAYMPNNLGYCGPDENGNIREHLEEGKRDERLFSTLGRFEAAYPFLKLIARNTGRGVYDYGVPEAYWIGNSLLGRVEPDDFYSFSERELKGSGMKNLRGSIKPLGGRAIPHHSFYVMGTYVGAAGQGPRLGEDRAKKIERLIDSCRISWGEVKGVSSGELQVEFMPISIGEGGLSLASPRTKRVKYNPLVAPFGSVKAGDVVSIHWDYACDILSERQARNLGRYTAADIRLTNSLLSADRSRSRK